MAVGDVVNGMSALATSFSFQPAGTNEIMVSHVFCGGTSIYPNMTNGVTTTNTSWDVLFGGAQKLFFNNTNYLNLPAVATRVSSFSGIQIK